MDIKSDFSKPQILQLPKIMDVRGNLSFLQNEDQIPFSIKRVFWIYDVPGGEKRGGHAFKTQQELIIVISGSIDIVVVDNKGNETKFCLNRSYSGLYIPPMHWRHLERPRARPASAARGIASPSSGGGPRCARRLRSVIETCFVSPSAMRRATLRNMRPISRSRLRTPASWV